MKSFKEFEAQRLYESNPLSSPGSEPEEGSFLKKTLKEPFNKLLSGDPEGFLKSMGFLNADGTVNAESRGPLSPGTKLAIGSGSSETRATAFRTLTSRASGIPGKDDFLLYLMHQQGEAGTKGLIQASMGTGELASDTIATKNGVRYANLMGNLPDNKQKIKDAIRTALNLSDQKSAAILFLSTWKEMWEDKSSVAAIEIEKKSNEKVRAAIEKYCEEYEVPFKFASSVAFTESSFIPTAHNKTYKGLFALSQKEFSKYVPGGNIFSIEDNTKAGIQCLANKIPDFIKFLGQDIVSTLNLSQWAMDLG